MPDDLDQRAVVRARYNGRNAASIARDLGVTRQRVQRLASEMKIGRKRNRLDPESAEARIPCGCADDPTPWGSALRDPQGHVPSCCQHRDDTRARLRGGGAPRVRKKAA